MPQNEQEETFVSFRLTGRGSSASEGRYSENLRRIGQRITFRPVLFAATPHS